jgi:undecaprenyl-diphosphatase
LAAVGAFVAFAVLTTLVAVGWAPLLRVDRRLSGAAHGYGVAHPVWVAGWRLVTHLGDSVTLVLVAIATVVLLLRRGLRREAVLVPLAALATQLASVVVREPLARARPVGGFVATHSWAFPSGHTLHSATAALVAVQLLWPYLKQRARWLTAAGAGVLAALVGVSRVMLLAHWPSDVLGGWLLAVAVVPALFSASAAVRRRRPPRARPPAAPHTPRPSSTLLR